MTRATKNSSQTLEPDRQGTVKGLSLSGFHDMAYADWGPIDAKETVVCVHGLTRQGRDFDALAHELAKAGYRVVCPDLVGRGKSGWLPSMTDYVFPQYCADMANLLASLRTQKLHWVGTSLGGLIGMVLAAVPGSPICSLVVNDIGPEVPHSASLRVSLRIAKDPRSFKSLEDAETYTRRTYAACGRLTDDQWRHLTIHSVKEVDGHLVPAIDPKVGTAFQWLFYYRMSLWSYWNKLEGPVMLIHGGKSDFVPASLVRSMRKATPHLETYEVAEAGHMPSLMVEDEIAAVKSFLRAG